jgi:hypothetical protein
MYDSSVHFFFFSIPLFIVNLKELVLRKLRLFIVTTNPLIVAEACNGLATGMMV